jgi:hypothetical protein
LVGRHLADFWVTDAQIAQRPDVVAQINGNGNRAIKSRATIAIPNQYQHNPVQQGITTNPPAFEADKLIIDFAPNDVAGL